MNPFEEIAREAGRALGDCGADAANPLVGEVARALSELAREPARRSRRRKSGNANRRSDPAAKSE